VEKLGVFPHGARLATFTPNGDIIILVTPDSEVQIHPFLDEGAPTIQYPYNGEQGSYINKIAVSPDAQEFASSSSSSLITIQSFDPAIPPQTLPQSSSAVTSLSYLTRTLIAVTLAERNRLLLFEFIGNQWTLHPWCHEAENMPLQIGITMDKCLGTFIVNNDISQVWLWGANWLAWVQPTAHYSPRKIDQHDKYTAALEAKSTNQPIAKPNECPNWITYRYREILLVDCLNSTPEKIELVVVERPRHEILEDITEPRFYRHEYGT
jgi:U3 small nucleolar RNA-associated protein 4